MRVLDGLEDEKKISWKVDSRSKRVLITTKQHIGSFTLEGPDKRINILPKFVKNFKEEGFEYVNRLVYYGENVAGLMEGRHHYLESVNDELINRLYWTLIQKCRKLMERGLMKSYVMHSENSPSLRGKMLLLQQMQNDARMMPEFFCEFDELEFDNNENRVILEALTLVERSSTGDTKMSAMDMARRMAKEVQQVPVPTIDRKNMMRSYTRLNERYKEVHQTCDQIIEKHGVKDIYAGDISHVLPVMEDMNSLFESFVQRLFEEHLHKSNGDYKGHRVETQLSEDAWKGAGGLKGKRKMRPDITMWEKEQCTGIVDVKYKEENVSTGDLYQLGFYMHEFTKKNLDMGGKTEIEKAFAVLPETKNGKSGTYTSRTGKTVHIKRIDVPYALDYLKEGKMKKLTELVGWLTDSESTKSFDYTT